MGYVYHLGYFLLIFFFCLLLVIFSSFFSYGSYFLIYLHALSFFIVCWTDCNLLGAGYFCYLKYSNFVT